MCFEIKSPKSHDLSWVIKRRVKFYRMLLQKFFFSTFAINYQQDKKCLIIKIVVMRIFQITLFIANLHIWR